MYLIEFDDVEVRPDPLDPPENRPVRIIGQREAATLIQKQVEASRNC